LSIAARLPRLANVAGVKTVPGFERCTLCVMSASMPDSAAGQDRALAWRFAGDVWSVAFMSEK
jgi:hypothetical protein